MIVFDFIQEYYINPIVYGTGYNIYNTLTYAVILILAAFLVFNLLRKLKISIDKKFLIGILPFIALGGILRALQDAGVVQSYLFITPLIYFVVFGVALVSLLAAIVEQKYRKTEYYKTWFIIGAIICLISLVNVKIVDLFSLLIIPAITAAWIIVMFAVKKVSEMKKYKANKFLSHTNLLVILVHMFDAATTFIALQFFGYFEQHVVPSLMIGMLGPASMFLIKLVVLIPVLYYLDKELENQQEQRTFIKMIVLLLGLAPGIRNFIRLVMGV